MEVAKLPAQRRTHLGTKHTRRLRQKGQVPAVIYGHGGDAIPIALEGHEIELVLHHHSRVVNLDLEGQADQYLIKAVQYDYLGTSPIHLDLMRVSQDERVKVTAEINLRGTPKGAHDGGVLLQLIADLDIECVVTAIPDEIRASVVDLGIGDALLVKDLELPPGVTPLASPDDKVAICRLPTETVEAAPAEGEGAEGAAGEPEVIGRGKEQEPDEAST